MRILRAMHKICPVIYIQLCFSCIILYMIIYELYYIWIISYMSYTIYELYHTWVILYKNYIIHELYYIWIISYMSYTIYELYHIWIVINKLSYQVNWNRVMSSRVKWRFIIIFIIIITNMLNPYANYTLSFFSYYNNCCILLPGRTFSASSMGAAIALIYN